MSHAFICLPTLESTTFEQQVCSAKIGYANTVLLGTNSRKKRMWTRWTAHIKQKSSATLTAVGLSDRKVYSRTTTKLIPLLQPEQGFFPKDGPESFQVPDWYPNVKMVVVPVCLHVSCFDVGCCSSECMRVVSH